jgi:hypothetical protein
MKFRAALVISPCAVGNVLESGSNEYYQSMNPYERASSGLSFPSGEQ